MIAALYVLPKGPYFGLSDVDPWDETRDARLYAGPWPVVAHPPCARWGRYYWGGPGWKGPRKVLGDDGGCFAAALNAVRQWGGVLEHPADSRAWAAHGLIGPSKSGGWFAAGDLRGWTCAVDQGHYGHRARKWTWLYAARVRSLPSLKWGRSAAKGRIDISARTTEQRRAIVQRGEVEQLSRRMRAATPAEFRDLLIQIARSVPIG